MRVVGNGAGALCVRLCGGALMCGCGLDTWCEGGCLCGCNHSSIEGMQTQGKHFALQYKDMQDRVRDAATRGQVQMMDLVTRSILDGHRGNGTAERDSCCQVCQEIVCDGDCPVEVHNVQMLAALSQKDAEYMAVIRLVGMGILYQREELL